MKAELCFPCSSASWPASTPALGACQLSLPTPQWWDLDLGSCSMADTGRKPCRRMHSSLPFYHYCYGLRSEWELVSAYLDCH